MHGLVYEIFEHWAIHHHHGLDTWHAIKEKAGCEVEDEAFVTRTYYRYDTWVDLINAASDQLDMSSSDILESYGHFNIKYHFDNGYGALLKCQGSTLRQWLSNLNAMHDHVQKSFPGDNYCPPVFWCEDCDEVEGSILLHYTSKRGNLLAPWVVGIVEEIAVTFFEVDVKMDQLVLQAENGPASTSQLWTG
jgi:guanylate cyclase soluble subunit beta